MKNTRKKERSALAKNIISRRKRLRWNQNVLAEKADIGVSTLREIETDVSPGSHPVKEAIAKALGCTVEDLQQRPQNEPNQSHLAPVKDLLDAIVRSELEKAMSELLSNPELIKNLMERMTDFEQVRKIYDDQIEKLKSENKALKAERLKQSIRIRVAMAFILSKCEKAWKAYLEKTKSESFLSRKDWDDSDIA